MGYRTKFGCSLLNGVTLIGEYVNIQTSIEKPDNYIVFHKNVPLLFF